MRKLYRTFLGIGLALGVGIAGAQTINKALQLSQDNTGAFSVDTNNGVYFPGHILNTGNSTPIPSVSSAVGTPSVTGTDVAGTVTMGTSSTGANLQFGRAYVSTPACVVSWQGPITTTTPMAYTLTTTGIALKQGSTSSNLINYFCTSAS